MEKLGSSMSAADLAEYQVAIVPAQTFDYRGARLHAATDLTAEENHPHLAAHGFPRPLVSQRLDRTLAVTRPDLLIVCYGMNDGSSLPNTDESTDRFATAVTRLRTAKNESVILPNSTILNTEVTNYSQQAGTDGLVIHSIVGIGIKDGLSAVPLDGFSPSLARTFHPIALNP